MSVTGSFRWDSRGTLGAKNVHRDSEHGSSLA
jgi:hypothetical protein